MMIESGTAVDSRTVGELMLEYLPEEVSGTGYCLGIISIAYGQLSPEDLRRLNDNTFP